MRILVTGGNGFIGAPLVEALAARGHRVRATRRPGSGAGAVSTSVEWVEADFLQPSTVQSWAGHLSQVDVVVNTVGVFHAAHPADFDTVHLAGAATLFVAAARSSGVRRVVQLSAIGAAACDASAFLRSKGRADALLRSLQVASTVVRPSLVFDLDGPSARRFAALATLPLLVLPGGGRQVVQPVHRDDVVAALCALVESAGGAPTTLDLVGEPITLRAYLQALRVAHGLPPAPVLPVPTVLVEAVLGLLPRGTDPVFTPDALRMLQRQAVSDPAPVRALLGRAPRPPEAFVPPRLRGPARAAAIDAWAVPLLRLALAVVWIGTAVVSLGAYPFADSLALLARLDLHGSVAWTLLVGAALLDLAFGIATLLRPSRALWLLQAATIVAYSLLIAWRLPEYWLHPFAPMLKNVPILAILAVLLASARR